MHACKNKNCDRRSKHVCRVRKGEIQATLFDDAVRCQNYTKSNDTDAIIEILVMIEAIILSSLTKRKQINICFFCFFCLTFSFFFFLTKKRHF